jgi:hypothetical protein
LRLKVLNLTAQPPPSYGAARPDRAIFSFVDLKSPSGREDHVQSANEQVKKKEKEKIAGERRRNRF